MHTTFCLKLSHAHREVTVTGTSPRHHLLDLELDLNFQKMKGRDFWTPGFKLGTMSASSNCFAAAGRGRFLQSPGPQNACGRQCVRAGVVDLTGLTDLCLSISVAFLSYFCLTCKLYREILSPDKITQDVLGWLGKLEIQKLCPNPHASDKQQM